MSQTNSKPTSGKLTTLFILFLIGILPFTSFADKFAEQQGVRLNSGDVEIFRDTKKPIPLQNQIVEKPTEPTASLEIKNDPEPKEEPKSQPRIDEIGVFVNDENRANLITKTREYIKKYQKGESPLDAEMLVNTAQKSNFPLDLILIQLHQENHFCTNGGDRLLSKNCFNVGNNDKGDHKPLDCNDGSSICLESYEKGIELYIYFMKSCHFHEGETISTQKFFDRDFRQVREGSKICGGVGKRYATDPNYRQNLTTILQTNFNPIFLT
jgi:hypothetical protein